MKETYNENQLEAFYKIVKELLNGVAYADMIHYNDTYGLSEHYLTGEEKKFLNFVLDNLVEKEV